MIRMVSIVKAVLVICESMESSSRRLVDRGVAGAGGIVCSRVLPALRLDGGYRGCYASLGCLDRVRRGSSGRCGVGISNRPKIRESQVGDGGNCHPRKQFPTAQSAPWSSCNSTSQSSKDSRQEADQYNPSWTKLACSVGLFPSMA